MNKAVDDNIARAYRQVMEVILYNDMFSSLNFGFAIWAASEKVRKESLSIFTNKDMACGHMCEANT